MISDLLASISMIRAEVPEDEFDPKLAAETAIESVDRDVSASERKELESVLPEWLDR